MISHFRPWNTSLLICITILQIKRLNVCMCVCSGDPLLSALLQRGLAVALAHIVKLGDVPKIRMYLDAHPHQVSQFNQSVG